MIEFIVVDFNGYIRWTPIDDEKYAVDPLYLEEFKTEMEIK